MLLDDKLGTLKDTLAGLLDHMGVNSAIGRMQNIINHEMRERIC